MADLLKKISDLTQGSPAENDVIPYVDLVAGETKKALKSELKGIQGDAATVDAGTTTTLPAGESATVTNVGTTSAAIFNFAIPQGIQGLTGADGACVESVAFVGNDMVFTLDDTSTVTLTNAKTDLKGDTGLTGAKITSASFVGDDLVFVLDDTSTVTVTGAKTTLKGDTGNPGADGDAATIAVGTVTTVANNVPASVTNSGTSAAAIFDFEIPKGLDGTGSGDITGSGTANELAYFTAEKTIDNLPVATYPSLTEVSYVKGVTSDIQTQLNGKQASGSYEVTTNKENTTLDTSTTKYPTNRLVKEYADGKVEDSIVDGHTTVAPSGNAVFDALTLKSPLASPTFTGTVTLPDVILGEAGIKLDDTLSGDEKYSGITIAGTLGATIAAGDLCYLNNDDSRWELVDANLSDGYDKQLGICLLGGNDASASLFLVFGKVRSAQFPSFTIGSPLYMSETAGDITHTQPTTADVCIRKIGIALSADDLLFNPSNDFIIHV